MALGADTILKGRTLRYDKNIDGNFEGSGVNDLKVLFTTDLTINGEKVLGIDHFIAGEIPDPALVPPPPTPPETPKVHLLKAFTTQSGQDYHEHVTLDDGTTLRSDGGAPINFDGKVDGELRGHRYRGPHEILRSG